jgi:hypothetical protein
MTKVKWQLISDKRQQKQNAAKTACRGGGQAFLRDGTFELPR